MLIFSLLLTSLSERTRYRRHRHRKNRARFNPPDAAISRHMNHPSRQRQHNLYEASGHSILFTKIWNVESALCSNRSPSRPISCVTLALRKTFSLYIYICNVGDVGDKEEVSFVNRWGKKRILPRLLLHHTRRQYLPQSLQLNTMLTTKSLMPF